jgi:RND family efflux transporter MFP subunit
MKSRPLHLFRRCALICCLAAAALLVVNAVHDSRVFAHGEEDLDSDDLDADAPRLVSAETARFIGLKTGEPAVRALAETLEFSGRVRIAPESRRKVCARFAGKIVSIDTRVGATVKPTDSVATLESPEVARNQLESRRMEAERQRLLLEIEKTKVEAESQRRTVRVSELQNEAAQNELKRTEAQHSTSPNAALELANRQETVTRTAGDLRINKLQLELAEGTVANLTRQAEAVADVQKILESLGPTENGVLKISAGGAGIVTAGLVVPGEWVQSGQTLFEIEDRSTVQIEADIPETQLGRVRARKSDRALVRAASDESVAIEGKATALSAAIHPVRRTATLFVQTPNTDNALLDDERVRVSLSVADARDVLTIPRSAVLTRGPQRFVFVKSGDVFQKQDIATGISDTQSVEVKAGLAPGDTIVTAGAEALLHLRPVTRTALSMQK